MMKFTLIKIVISVPKRPPKNNSAPTINNPVLIIGVDIEATTTPREKDFLYNKRNKNPEHKPAIPVLSKQTTIVAQAFIAK